MIFELVDLEPIMFFLIIIFGVAFAVSYTIFDGNFVIILGLFNLLLFLSLVFDIISGTYYPIFFIVLVIMLYLEFKPKET